jgi:phage shock protein PspC (stress-responsive transcriptional regulator)
MSAMNPEEIPHEVKDGVVAGVLGGLAMVARLLLSTEPVTIGWVIRRVLAAAITAAIVGYAIQDHIQSPGLRMGAVGAAGYAAPECLDYLMKYIKARGEKEVAKVSVKPNGKGKAKRRG